MLKYDPKIKREQLLSVHESDVIDLFTKLGFLDNLKSRSLKCTICSNVITETSFGAVFKKNNQIYFLCDNPSCKNKIQDNK